MSKPIVLYLEIFFLTVLPLYFMTTKTSVLAARPLLMAVGGLYCALRLLRSHARLTDLGLTLKNFGTDPLSISSFSARLAFYVFGSAPVQELIFRGYVTWRLEQVFHNRAWIYFLSVGVFTLLHTPFHSPIMVMVALFLGIVYLHNYLIHRNLLAVSLSHAFIGAVLIFFRNAYLPYT
ncbi:MAG: hypothetical protein UX59_C0031G0008 [Microgenomates group bacterium GW2011_GWA1_46_7]|nr:MAG: hypothetical protein UX59_C0031G0008 [Microgenomates group bacterium GW2011_GWA1_46_7]